MASLLVGSQVLDKHKTQHIIGVSESQIYLAADLPSKFIFDEVSGSPVQQQKGQLRVLRRTFCSAEELHVLVCIPFQVDSCCTVECMDKTTSLAIYHLAGEHIYAFANGYFNNELTSSISVLRISVLTGEYTRFKLASLDGDNYGGCGWQACSNCRASQLRLQEEGILFLHDTLVLTDELGHNQPTQAIKLTLNEKKKNFRMYCREWQYPGLHHLSTNLPLLPINNKCSLWACLTPDQLVLCKTQRNGPEMLVAKPDEDAQQLLNGSHSYSLHVDPSQHNRLQLVVEPMDPAPLPFLFFDFGFSTDDQVFDLTLVGKSSVPRPGSPVLCSCSSSSGPSSSSSSRVYVAQDVLYKFYGTVCFTSFLRMPSLAEIAFVALQKGCGLQVNGVTGQGIGPEELNDQLGVCLQWF